MADKGTCARGGCERPAKSTLSATGESFCASHYVTALRHFQKAGGGSLRKAAADAQPGQEVCAAPGCTKPGRSRFAARGGASEKFCPAHYMQRMRNPEEFGATRDLSPDNPDLIKNQPCSGPGCQRMSEFTVQDVNTGEGHTFCKNCAKKFQLSQMTPEEHEEFRNRSNQSQRLHMENVRNRAADAAMAEEARIAPIPRDVIEAGPRHVADWLDIERPRIVAQHRAEQAQAAQQPIRESIALGQTRWSTVQRRATYLPQEGESWEPLPSTGHIITPNFIAASQGDWSATGGQVGVVPDEAHANQMMDNVRFAHRVVHGFLDLHHIRAMADQGGFGQRYRELTSGVGGLANHHEVALHHANGFLQAREEAGGPHGQLPHGFTADTFANHNAGDMALLSVRSRENTFGMPSESGFVTHPAAIQPERMLDVGMVGRQFTGSDVGSQPVKPSPFPIPDDEADDRQSDERRYSVSLRNRVKQQMPLYHQVVGTINRGRQRLSREAREAGREQPPFRR